MGKLVLILPDGRTRDIPLDRERITIGRRADNDVCLPFPAVSGEHAAVVTILDDSFLEDLSSTNGTLVNGKSVAKHFLRDHDEIDIGRQMLVYVSGDGDSMPAGGGRRDEGEDEAGSGRGIGAREVTSGVGRSRRRRAGSCGNAIVRDARRGAGSRHPSRTRRPAAAGGSIPRRSCESRRWRRPRPAMPRRRGQSGRWPPRPSK